MDSLVSFMIYFIDHFLIVGTIYETIWRIVSVILYCLILTGVPVYYFYEYYNQVANYIKGRETREPSGLPNPKEHPDVFLAMLAMLVIWLIAAAVISLAWPLIFLFILALIPKLIESTIKSIAVKKHHALALTCKNKEIRELAVKFKKKVSSVKR